MDNIDFKEKMIQDFELTFTDLNQFLSKIDFNQYFYIPSKGWSIDENIRHLNKSIFPIATSLSLPKLTFLIFGLNSKPSRDYDTMVFAYTSKLKSGSKAGVFTPLKNRNPNDKKMNKSNLSLNNNKNLLVSQLNKWSEKDLDKFRMPHPILGILTVREMLFFTLYHTRHHLNNMKNKIST